MKSQGDYLLEVSGLNVRLQGQTILENVSFKVKRGTTLAIVGPNGAGKTVLFRALLNLVPYTGEIRWTKGVKIGYVPQKLSVTDIPISVREFLSFKKVPKIETWPRIVGLDDRNILDRTLSVLSGGQLQRVLIEFAVVIGLALLIAYNISQQMVVPILGPTIALFVFFAVFVCIFIPYLWFRYSALARIFSRSLIMSNLKNSELDAHCLRNTARMNGAISF